MNSLEPKLVTVLREGYGRSQFGRDLAAGVLVGVVAVPLAIAFGIASGVEPQQGLVTAVVAGFLISVLSGSRVQIGGPTGAFIVLIYGVVQEFGYDGLAVATLMAGGLLVAMGFARLGGLIRYVPYPVTVGFTAGVAVVIASGQVRDALGLEMAAAPAEFIPKWVAYAGAFGTLNLWAAGLTLATIVIVVALPRVVPRVPASLVALLAATAAVAAFGLPVETIGSRFGALPSGLPAPRLPRVDLAVLPELISPALSIALLAAIESLLSAVVADGMTGRRHRSNAELVAQGVANLASPLFGGTPATGAIARTATNVKAGGRTPVAGIVHAITVLVVLVVAGRWAALVPMPVLAGILLVVAYNMSEAHLFRRVLTSTTRSDALVLVVTFGLTVFVDLTVAIQVGVVLAALLFMRRMADLADARAVRSDDAEEDPARTLVLREVPPGVEVFEVTGPFFFGAAHKFASSLARIEQRPRAIVLEMADVPALDATGLRALETLQDDAERGGPVLVLAGVQAQPVGVLGRSGLLGRLGTQNVTPTLADALARGRELVEGEPFQQGAL
ncbi:MAG: SulP family inorganic anion transporter [Acidobacteriota bacterium]|nr:SulP family inorganic anion transporter [Acidobacteriota bacterium]